MQNAPCAMLMRPIANVSHTPDEMTAAIAALVSTLSIYGEPRKANGITRKYTAAAQRNSDQGRAAALR